MGGARGARSIPALATIRLRPMGGRPRLLRGLPVVRSARAALLVRDPVAGRGLRAAASPHPQPLLEIALDRGAGALARPDARSLSHYRRERSRRGRRDRGCTLTWVRREGRARRAGAHDRAGGPARPRRLIPW